MTSTGALIDPKTVELEHALAQTHKLFDEAWHDSNGDAHPLGQDMSERILQNQIAILAALIRIARIVP